MCIPVLYVSPGTIDRLKVIYAEGGETPMDDGVAEVRQLCISVEEVLRHQQKGVLCGCGLCNFLEAGPPSV